MATAGLTARMMALKSPAPIASVQGHVDLAEPGLAQGVVVSGGSDRVGAARDAGRCAVVGAGTDDVADPHTTARAQDAGDLGERGVLVAGQHDDAVGDDDIDRGVAQRDSFDRAVEELDVCHTGLDGVAAGELEHLDGRVESVHEPGRPDATGRQQHVDPATGPEVHDGVTGLQVDDRGRVAAAEAGSHRGVRKTGQVVVVAGTEAPAGYRGAVTGVDPAGRLGVALEDSVGRSAISTIRSRTHRRCRPRGQRAGGDP